MDPLFRKDKLSKDDPRVRYQYAPGSGGERCSTCNMFVAFAACTSVAGVIDRNGWCNLFATKLGVQRRT
jgi:hypothetical protein